jgi:thioredoxin-related protein
MKSILFALLMSIMLPTHEGWKTDFEMAKTEAAKSQKLILLNFSGSDWCNPCRQMKRKIFDDATFIKYADENLILINADFPRNKKNQLSSSLKSQNEQLAETYEVNMFPMTILLDSVGNEITRWEGSYQGSAAKFVKSIEKASK